MGQMNKAMGMWMSIGVSAGAMVFAGGCSSGLFGPAQSNANPVHNDVTDIRPIEPAAPAAYQPPVIDNSGLIPTAPQAVTSADSSAGGTVMMSTTPATPAIGEKTHVVRHGETLFSIAKATYGSGKDWKKIAAANPGITPSKLKVGQVLAMP